ncbi:hypothetical protein EVB87_019 [Rhizobium phage RHph_N28_1]|nr:hypothetical protein EVB87_019 [Rhizobium phage RHph_N28_1]QIG74047.1 hypothetical protein EVC07_019 [Rhizobium phage RHph_N42]
MGKTIKKLPPKKKPVASTKKKMPPKTGNTLERLSEVLDYNQKRGIENEQAIAKEMLATMDARLEEMAKLPSSDLLNEYVSTMHRVHGHFLTKELRGAWERYWKRLRSVIVGRMNGADRLVKKVRPEPSVIIDRNLLQGVIKALKLSTDKKHNVLYKSVRKHFTDTGEYRRDDK